MPRSTESSIGGNSGPQNLESDGRIRVAATTSYTRLPSMSVLFCLTVVCFSTCQAADSTWKFPYPTEVTLRAAVLTHAPPFAHINEADGTFFGLQPDLLEEIKGIAKGDGVQLNLILDEAPLYGYTLMFNRMSENCNSTDNPQPLEDCWQYDMLIGDFYTNPDRSLQTDFTPPWLRTSASAVKLYTPANEEYQTDGGFDISTMEQASQANATVCVVYDSYMDAVVEAKYPNTNYYRCPDQDDCVATLKASGCVLFVDDELQLRYRAVDDPELQLTRENFNSQFIVWPLRSSLDPVTVRLMKRWVYAAQSRGIMDDLFHKYFSINLCPLGKAGKDCDLPCDPNHGQSDRLGVCVCESSRYTGPACEIELTEDVNQIPPALKWLGYSMVGINIFAVLCCGIWLVANWNTPQVRVAQPFFLFLVLIGCLISTSTIIVLAQESLTANVEDGFLTVHSACMAIPWLYSIGFSITFGTLFAKIYRVYRLFKAAIDMRRVRVSIQETILIIGGILLVDVAILLVWTLVDPLCWERTVLSEDIFGVRLSSEGHCESDHWMTFASLIAVLHFGLMAVACYMCYVAREIPTKFSEGKYLAIAMISNLQIFVVGVPVLIILGSDPKTSFFVRSVIIWMNDLVVLALIFGNLMVSVIRDKRDNVDSNHAIQSAMRRYTLRASKGAGGSSVFGSHRSSFRPDNSAKPIRVPSAPQFSPSQISLGSASDLSACDEVDQLEDTTRFDNHDPADEESPLPKKIELPNSSGVKQTNDDHALEKEFGKCVTAKQPRESFMVATALTMANPSDAFISSSSRASNQSSSHDENESSTKPAISAEGKTTTDLEQAPDTRRSIQQPRSSLVPLNIGSVPVWHLPTSSSSNDSHGDVDVDKVNIGPIPETSGGTSATQCTFYHDATSDNSHPSLSSGNEDAETEPDRFLPTTEHLT